MAGEFELLKPNEQDPREMAVYDSVPESDRQAWLHFIHDSYRKEALGVAPAYTFDQFENGLAPHIPQIISMVDGIVDQGFRGRALIGNYREAVEVQSDGGAVIVEPLLTAFDATKETVNKHRRRGPTALLVPHTSLPSPYLVARSFIETHGHDIAEKVYIVIGPRPATLQFEVFNKQTKQIDRLPPVTIGRAMANVILTGPDTDSTRNNPELEDWLKELRRNFWKTYNKITTPQSDGDNSVVIFCPAGRVAEQQESSEIKEHRVDGSLAYLVRENLAIMPVGAYDRLLVDSESPESLVYVNPDKSLWFAQNENQATWLHERAVELSNYPLGKLTMESVTAQKLRLARQRIRHYVGRSSEPAYLVE